MRNLNRFWLGFLRLTLLVVSLSMVGGCADLSEVRTFATEAATLPDEFGAMGQVFQETWNRQEPYLFGDARKLAAENHKKRQAIAADLDLLRSMVDRYLRSLADLAGESRFDRSHQLEELPRGMLAHPQFGLDERHAQAYGQVGNVLARWTAETVQQVTVKDLVIASDAPLQLLLDAMDSLLRVFVKAHDEERKQVLGLFESELPFAEERHDRLLVALGRAKRQSLERAYLQTDLRLQRTAALVRSVSTGHTVLAREADRLSVQEVRLALSAISRDIREIRSTMSRFQLKGS